MCTHSSISTSTVLYTFNAMQCEYWSTRTKIKGSKSHPFIASQWTKKGLGLVCDFPHWCQEIWQHEFLHLSSVMHAMLWTQVILKNNC